MKIICPSKAKDPYKKVIEELAKRAKVEVKFVKKMPKIDATTVLLDERGEPLDMEKLKEIVKKNPVFIVGGHSGIDFEADYRISLGNYTLNHQIAIIVLLDLLFRALHPEHPYNRH